MNRLLYGDDDPRAIDLQYSNEPCEHCYGDGQIYYLTDSGEQISKEEYDKWRYTYPEVEVQRTRKALDELRKTKAGDNNE